MQSAQIAAIKLYFSTPTVTGANAGGADIMRWIRSLELRQREFSGAKLKAVFFGSPLVTAPEAYSMVHRWPSDGFLMQRDSLYSVIDKGVALKDVDIHVVHSATMNEFSERNRDFHANKIKIFYGRLIAHMGGNLASFNGSADHLRALTSTAFPKIHYGELEGGSKPVIYEVLSPQLIKAESSRQESLWANRIDKNPLVVPQGDQPFDLGITWDKDVDIDVYVKADNDEELFFNRITSIKYKGRFLKDLRSQGDLKSGSNSNGFETVIYETPVPLTTVKVFINHYSGVSLSPINGEFRIRVNGNIYYKKFQLAAGIGTRGAGNRVGNSSWVEINVPALLGLTRS